MSQSTPRPVALAGDHYERAKLLIEQRKYKLAVKEVLVLLSQDPDDAAAHSLLGYSQARLKHFPEAISAAQKAISLAPETALYHFRLADVCLLAQKYRLGIEAIEKALQLDPQAPDYYEMAGLLYDCRGMRDDALTFANKGLQLNPQHLGCLQVRIFVLSKTKDAGSADADIAQLLQLFPDRAFPHVAKGQAAIRKGQITAAKECFKSALQIEPDNSLARHGMKEAIKAESAFYRLFLRLRRRLNYFQQAKPRLFFALCFAVPYLRLAVWTFLGAILAVYYLFDVFLRMHPYGRLLFTEEEKRLNNCGTFMLLSCGLGAIATVYAQDSNFLLMCFLAGVAVYSICLRKTFFDSPLLKGTLAIVASVCLLVIMLLLVSYVPVVSAENSTHLVDVSLSIVRIAFNICAVLFLIILFAFALRVGHKREKPE